jgi:single-stranded-DNA-specific exonuclease
LLNPATQPLATPPIAGLRQLAETLLDAVHAHQPIGIHGDYDADGITSSALLTLWLRAHGATVVPFIPHREIHGYGITRVALDTLRAQGCQLVLAVDCGITAGAEAAYAAQHGMTLLVLDHHTPPAHLPQHALLVDPKLAGGDADNHCLTAAGLAYRLAGELVALGQGTPEQLAHYLDLACLGTIADVAPLTGQNRLLVAHGLAELRSARRAGLRALMASSSTKPSLLTAEDVGFRLAPRLNAAGRIDDARLAFDLLLAATDAEAAPLAAKLETLNVARQHLASQAEHQALAQLGSVTSDQRLLLVHGADWKLGIVGLVAGKLKEAFHRPAVALATAPDGMLKGSARSIDGFDITAALRACGDLLAACGGHAHSAGLSLDAHNLPLLKARLNELACAQLQPEQLVAVFQPEARVLPHTLTVPLVRALDQLGPFGAGNDAPLLQLSGMKLDGAWAAGQAGQHTQLKVWSNAGAFRGIAFNQLATSFPTAGSTVDVLFVPAVDEYLGNQRVQLKVASMRPAASS